MTKDIIVNLEHAVARDSARDFFLSVSETFGAHIAGGAFAYQLDFRGYAMAEILANLIGGACPFGGEKNGGIGRFQQAMVGRGVHHRQWLTVQHSPRRFTWHARRTVSVVVRRHSS